MSGQCSGLFLLPHRKQTALAIRVSVQGVRTCYCIVVPNRSYASVIPSLIRL
jgi:hypothetical protein